MREEMAETLSCQNCAQEAHPLSHRSNINEDYRSPEFNVIGGNLLSSAPSLVSNAGR